MKLLLACRRRRKRDDCRLPIANCRLKNGELQLPGLQLAIGNRQSAILLERSKKVRLALLQLNPTVGALEANADRIIQATLAAAKQGAELALTAELGVAGYLPRDLLLEPAFIQNCWNAVQKIAAALSSSIPVLVGVPLRNVNRVGRSLFNAAVLLQNGEVKSNFYKTLMPTYDVFDEDRYFEPGTSVQILEMGGQRLGISICEDLWNDRDFWSQPRYHTDPIEGLAKSNVSAIVNLSSSPFTAGKQRLRERMLAAMALKYKLPILYCNQIGGNDDLVFDGRSLAIDASGQIRARGKAFEEDLIIADLPATSPVIAQDTTEPEEEIWRALVLGTRDYANKCGFKKVLLGLSGGIDSALTAAIATEAMGNANVTGVLMPSPYSSEGSLSDATALAKNLGIATHAVPIVEMMNAFETQLKPLFGDRPPDVTEENLQSRIRGVIMMALANKFGSLLLTTGNKSELAVGYCTLYGDMNGGLAVIADVPKTTVYRIARWLNRNKTVIPQASITKPPSAELRPNQTDQDSLPEYDVLDAILEQHIVKHKSADEIISDGFPAEGVKKVVRLVKLAEFKRKQAAPGIKVTDRAFGTGWRMPIARQ
jgi:NAD+ synthase (glutamine-hydrolysing)